ncbi:competence protein ComFC [Solibacillus kalamii]|uniref:Amidophosphoribosyltransferase n=1 Tax=Solibacillus kalamii TaxID=1748298 RepID=A0ABX3ZM36_9BACL|nr:ComF family protein [Solibacillus kalamii]MBM7664858.1 competence protein ComFC [Solibacillus kalamii]OUZ40769.1 amidophosphoribosyltransferase [Solibacillus kalamii]
MNKPILNCLLCDRELQQSIGWKELLLKTLPQTICPRCEQRFQRIEQQQEEGIVSLFHYNEAMKDYLHRYKFLHDILLAKVFNKILHEQLKNETRVIIPIPMHPENLRLRTFAHIDELLKAANIPFTHHLTKLSNEQQSLKTREERLQTPQLFEVINPYAIKDKNLLVVDDIYTTGTTLNHAKKALVEAGAKTVDGFTLIHG